MTKTVRIVVAGAGQIGRDHIRETLASPEAELVGVVDPVPQAKAIADQAGVPLYETLAQGFEQAKPDGVILAVPNQFHLPLAVECLETGIPVLVEKPITATVAEAQQLVDTQARTEVSLLVGHHRRHSPILATTRKIIEDGTLGTLVSVVGTAMFYKADSYFEVAPWRTKPGGGPILINMIHEADNLQLLCGDIVAVQATASNHARGFEVEDTVAITLKFANGVLGAFLLSDASAAARSWEQTSQENKNYPNYPDEDCYVIAGTRGCLEVPTMRLRTYPDVASWFTPFDTKVVPVERADPFAQEFAHFVKVIRGEVAPLVTARDGMRSLQVVEAIIEATRTGGTVEIAR